MSDEDELIHCVVTGELYDHERIRAELESKRHSFKTKSDSELVVQLLVIVHIHRWSISS
jgi:asparagine synthase (glutamine-hydrolysing)